MNSFSEIDRGQNDPIKTRLLKLQDPNIRKGLVGHVVGSDKKADTIKKVSTTRGKSDASARSAVLRSVNHGKESLKSAPKHLFPHTAAVHAFGKYWSVPKAQSPPPPPPPPTQDEYRSLKLNESLGEQSALATSQSSTTANSEILPPASQASMNGSFFHSAKTVPTSDFLVASPLHVRPNQLVPPQTGYSAVDAHYYLQQQGHDLGIAEASVRDARQENEELKSLVAALKKELEQQTAKKDFFKRKITETTEAYQKLKASNGFHDLVAKEQKPEEKAEQEPSTSA